MTYVILHGTLTNIEKGEISDDAICVSFITGQRENPWDYRKFLTKDAECVLWDGNYFSEEDEGVNDSSWTEEKRNLVHDKWLGLIDIIDKQLEEKGRFDIDLINYFSFDFGDSDDTKKSAILYLKSLIKKIENDEIDLSDIIKILGDAYV